MILGVGVDILNIERISAVYARHGKRFVQRVLTEKEQKVFAQRKYSINYLAKQFSAKEAISKAFGTGIGRLSFIDIEVLRTEKGQPVAKILPSASAEFLQGALHLSLSDTKAQVIAYAILSKT